MAGASQVTGLMSIAPADFQVSASLTATSTADWRAMWSPWLSISSSSTTAWTETAAFSFSAALRAWKAASSWSSWTECPCMTAAAVAGVWCRADHFPAGWSVPKMSIATATTSRIGTGTMANAARQATEMDMWWVVCSAWNLREGGTGRAGSQLVALFRSFLFLIVLTARP